MEDGPSDSPELDDPRYQELRTVARRLLGQRRRFDDPDPTELVHECFVRLSQNPNWSQLSAPEQRAYTARALSNTLVDLRRRQDTDKRGGLRSRLTLDDRMVEAGAEQTLDLLDLSSAIEALAESHRRQAEVVVLRYLGGMTLEEVAAVLGVTVRTVQTDWRFACAWLHRRLGA